jgi:hypothetical protein
MAAMPSPPLPAHDRLGRNSVGRRAVKPHELASAAVLAAGSHAALSHGSAMVLWGFWRHWDKPFEVTVVGDRRTKGIRVHRSTTLRRREITTQLGIRTTTPARTLFDMAPRLNDKSLKRTANSALGSPWLTENPRRFVTVRITWERIEQREQREAARLHKILANQRAIHAPRAA